MTCAACGGLLELDAAFCGVCGSRLRARRETLVGAVLSDTYRIDAKLAEGGFGSIYQATHVDSGLDVALKVLHADLAADPSLAARFRREGTTLSRLHDRHTVATYDVGEAPDGTLYIAMELLRGESLHDRMTAQGRIPWRESLAIIRDVCSALAEAHELGIVHRDLKPANVHLSTSDLVKLLDFGIAKVAGSEVDDGAELTRLGQTIGTVEYMAPEQIIGGSCEPRSDIYQLGVLMFEMITGRRPFADAVEPTAMITALLTQMPPLLSSVPGGAGIPVEVETLIMRCLEPEPEHRFANVSELVDAIAGAHALPTAPAMYFSAGPPAGDEATWIGGSPGLRQAQLPRVTARIPAAQLQPANMPSFEVPVRGSVADARPLEGTGEVMAISDYVVEALGSEPRHARIPTPSAAPLVVAPPPSVSMLVPLPRRALGTRAPALAAPPPSIAPPAPAAQAAPASHLSFAARIALWATGLAISGAVVGGLLALVAG